MFKYYLESTEQEREAMEAELKQMYNDALDAENSLYIDAISRCGDQEHARRVKGYQTALTRLGTLQGVFEVLHVDYEPGKKFDI